MDSALTTPALQAVARLRRLAVALEAGDADSKWLAQRLARYLAEAPLGLANLELLFDLDPGPGGVTWFEEERRDQRDTLLRDMAMRHFPGQDPGPAAKEIMAAWRRYSRNRLASDRRRGESSDQPGTLGADLFELSRVGGPPDGRQIRNIIAATKQPDAA